MFAKIIKNEVPLIVNNVWAVVGPTKYGNRSDIEWGCAKHVFSDMNRRTIRKIKRNMVRLMFYVHNILVHYGIYDTSRGVSEYKDIAAHIILRGRTYCINIVNNPEKAIPLLKNNEYHPIWSRSIYSID
jgi:hypothetical protein